MKKGSIMNVVKKNLLYVALCTYTLITAQNQDQPESEVVAIDQMTHEAEYQKILQEEAQELKNLYPYQPNVLISQEEFNTLLHEPEQDIAYRNMMSHADHEELRSVNQKKPWTFIVYMAADNDLAIFSYKNLKQMELIGSNENINVIVQLNTPGYFNPTKRYVIKKNRRLLVDADGSLNNQKLNSGSPYTLINCVQWAVDHYPADNYALILWNHGTGACDPVFARTISPTELFSLNPINKMLELDRSIGFLDFLERKTIEEARRGIAFDETFKSFMTNTDIDFALHEIYNNVLGKKLSIIGFDACLMSMIEIANIAKHYADYMVSSEEVELGLGWDYAGVLRPFTQGNLSPKDFAQNIARAYENLYAPITQDYTQSALDLTKTATLETHLNTLAQLLLEALNNQKNNSVKKILKLASSPKLCISFDEPSYKDIGHLCKNIEQRIGFIELHNKAIESRIKADLKNTIRNVLNTLQALVVENRTGTNLKEAMGLAIYFPEGQLTHSYLKNPFAAESAWSMLIAKYILL
ncbi:hypothetical protein EBQ93_01180 [bacterium]|nr:hypothetical protein [bacterium]